MFKKMIQAGIAASLVASPMVAAAADAQSRQVTTTVQQRPNGTVVKKTVVRQQPNQWRTWRKGQRFDRRYARNYRVIDYRQYRGARLYAPPRGHQWVRSGNDAVLISNRNGTITTVISNVLR